MVIYFLMCRYALLYGREESGYDSVKDGVICFEFLTGVHCVVHAVDRIPLLVYVEPALHSLCPIFIYVASSVGVCPSAVSKGCVKPGLKFGIEVLIYRTYSDLMDCMGELMDKDVLFPISVTLKAEHVFFSA